MQKKFKKKDAAGALEIFSSATVALEAYLAEVDLPPVAELKQNYIRYCQLATHFDPYCTKKTMSSSDHTDYSVNFTSRAELILRIV